MCLLFASFSTRQSANLKRSQMVMCESTFSSCERRKRWSLRPSISPFTVCASSSATHSIATGRSSTCSVSIVSESSPPSSGETRSAHSYPQFAIRRVMCALRAIVACRTSALGGHLAQCDSCAREHLLYHSCRHRACPKCGHDRAKRWLERRQELLLLSHEFLRRFLQHVPPRGFHRVRAFGLLHPRHRLELRRLQPLLGAKVSSDQREEEGSTRAKPHPCPHCGAGQLRILLTLSRADCEAYERRLNAPPLPSVARAPPRGASPQRAVA
jgi:predicted RNA-binding Zn-ribbon protein involved in translation (DUF1610 family)